jgi:hypothetical protein
MEPCYIKSVRFGGLYLSQRQLSLSKTESGDPLRDKYDFFKQITYMPLMLSDFITLVSFLSIQFSFLKNHAIDL